MQPGAKPNGLFREAWERTKRFVLPEEAASLKLVFDNVRNYLICAAVIGAIGALSPRNSEGQPIWPLSIVVMAALLLGANFVQSWLLLDRMSTRVGRFQKEVRPKWGKLRRRLLRVLLVLIMIPIIISAIDLFQMLIQWAARGGKQISGGGL